MDFNSFANSRRKVLSALLHARFWERVVAWKCRSRFAPSAPSRAFALELVRVRSLSRPMRVFDAIKRVSRLGSGLIPKVVCGRVWLLLNGEGDEEAEFGDLAGDGLDV